MKTTKAIDTPAPADLAIEKTEGPPIGFHRPRIGREKWSAGYSIEHPGVEADTGRPVSSWSMSHGPQPTRAAALAHVRAIFWDAPRATAWITSWPTGKTTFYRLGAADAPRALAHVRAANAEQRKGGAK